MEQIDFKIPRPVEPKNWYEEVMALAKRLNTNKGFWMKALAGISHEDLCSIIRSAESLSKDKGLPFSQAFRWHTNKMGITKESKLSTSSIVKLQK